MTTEKIPPRPQCPIGWHNRIMQEIEYCHTHQYKWRQWIHEKHCKKLKCPFALDPKYGKWDGYFDTRDKKIIG
jgi:hypothetical protein